MKAILSLLTGALLLFSGTTTVAGEKIKISRLKFDFDGSRAPASKHTLKVAQAKLSCEDLPSNVLEAIDQLDAETSRFDVMRQAERVKYLKDAENSSGDSDTQFAEYSEAVQKQGQLVRDLKNSLKASLVDLQNEQGEKRKPSRTAGYVECPEIARHISSEELANPIERRRVQLLQKDPTQKALQASYDSIGDKIYQKGQKKAVRKIRLD